MYLTHSCVPEAGSGECDAGMVEGATTRIMLPVNGYLKRIPDLNVRIDLFVC